MPRYQIEGGRPLEGTITISGAKNAAVAIIPATLLVQGCCRIENVPDISDVHILLDILEQMGASVRREPNDTVEIDCSRVVYTEPNPALVQRIRASYYLIGAQLGRFSRSRVALPGGAISLRVPSTSISRDFWPWAPRWRKPMPTWTPAREKSRSAAAG